MSELAQAFYAFQCEVTNPPLDKEGYGYRYVTLPKMIDHVKPLLDTHGLYFRQHCTHDGDQIGVTTYIGHKSGEEWECGTVTMTVGQMKGMSHAQAAGSVLTYCRRYALQSALGIVGDPDTDAAVQTLSDSHQWHIEHLVATAGADLEKIFQHYKITALSELTPKQAETLVKQLEKKIDEREV